MGESLERERRDDENVPEKRDTMKANPIFKSKVLSLLSSKSQKTELSQKPPPPLLKERRKREKGKGEAQKVRSRS